MDIAPCSICGRGRTGLLRNKLNPVLPCLADANDRHHAACRSGCDACVAAARTTGGRR